MPSVFSKENTHAETQATLEVLATALLESLKSQVKHLCVLQRSLRSDLWFLPFDAGPKGLPYMLGFTWSEFRAMLIIVYNHETKGKHVWGPTFSKGNEKCLSIAYSENFARSLDITIVERGSYKSEAYWCVNSGGSPKRTQKFNPRYNQESDSNNPFRDTEMSDVECEKFMTAVTASGGSVLTKCLLASADMLKIPHTRDDAFKGIVLLREEQSNILVFPNANQRHKHYVGVPVTTWKNSVDATAENALQNWDVDTLKSFLRTFLRYEGTDGDWELNAAKLLDRILTLRYELKQGNSSVQQMSVPEALAMARDAKLSDNGMKTLRRYLRHCFGRIALPGKDRVSEYKKFLKIPKQEFKEFQVKNDKIKFAYINPMETVHHLISKYKSLGECIIGEGGSFGVNVQIDKGGGSVKFILLLASPCVEGQHFPTTIGTYNGSDDYDHLKAFFEHYNDSLRDMLKVSLLHIKRGEEWDYVLVPSDKYPPHSGASASQCLPDGLRFAPSDDGTVVLIDPEGNVLHTLPWSMEDIESELETTYTQLQLFLSADLQCHSTLLGRENAAGHFCPYCSSTKSHNADVNCNLPLLTLASLKAKCGEYIAPGSAITQKPLLLDMIDPENRIVSTHLRLGISTHMLKTLYLEVLRFEQMHKTEIRVAYATQYALNLEVQNNRTAYKTAVSDVNAKKKPADVQYSMSMYRAAIKLVSEHEETCAQADQAIRKLTEAVNKQHSSSRQREERERQLEEGRCVREEHIAHRNAAIAEHTVLRSRVMQYNPASYVLEHQIELNLSQDEILACEKESRNYSAAETTLALTSKAYKQKCAAFCEAEKTLSELLRNDKKEQNGMLTDLQLKVKQIIKNHQIESAIWFGGESTLQGENSWRLFDNAERYIPEILKICHKYCEPLAQEDCASHRLVWAAFVEFSKNYQDAAAAASKIYRTTESVRFLTDEAFDKLETEVQVFSAAWRKLGWSLTPKFHVTEKHLLSMAATGYMGLMSEGIVERVHYYYNLYMPRTNNSGSWEGNQRRMHYLLELYSDPEVILASWKVNKKGSKKTVREDIPDDPIAKKSRGSADSFAYTSPGTYQGSRRAQVDAKYYTKAIIPKSEIK